MRSCHSYETYRSAKRSCRCCQNRCRQKREQPLLLDVYAQTFCAVIAESYRVQILHAKNRQRKPQQNAACEIRQLLPAQPAKRAKAPRYKASQCFRVSASTTFANAAGSVIAKSARTLRLRFMLAAPSKCSHLSELHNIIKGEVSPSLQPPSNIITLVRASTFFRLKRYKILTITMFLILFCCYKKTIKSLKVLQPRQAVRDGIAKSSNGTR